MWIFFVRARDSVYLCSMKRTSLSPELLFYTSVLGVLYASPIVVEWLLSGDTQEVFSWSDIFRAWLKMLPFVIVFLIHNFLMLPLLLRKGRRTPYLVSIAAVLAIFFLYQCQTKPLPPPHEPPMDQVGERKTPDKHPHFRPKDGGPRHVKGQREVWDTLILMLVLGMNLGVKLYLRQREDAKKMEELEHRSLEQQLAQLRYQMNPHFLMNTLNNIHALVEINPTEAQQSIVELSRLLRYVLYEADKKVVPLRNEVAFIQHYIALMRVRYDDNNVHIHVQMPDPVPEVCIPSLLFITFVENAFKHGISYQHASFIDLSITVSTNERQLTFVCTNSCHPVAMTSAGEGGVGLRNVRQRLDLLYADRYQLAISEEAATYDVRLMIPLEL